MKRKQLEPVPAHGSAMLADAECAIGKLVTNCTQLEWFAYIAVTRLATDPLLAEEAAGKEFKARVLLLMKLSRERVRSNLREEWLRTWERVVTLADQRNAIVHNPMMVELLASEAGVVSLGEFRLFPFRDPENEQKQFRLEDISRHADAAHSLCMEVSRLMTRVWLRG